MHVDIETEWAIEQMIQDKPVHLISDMRLASKNLILLINQNTVPCSLYTRRAKLLYSRIIKYS